MLLEDYKSTEVSRLQLLMRCQVGGVTCSGGGVCCCYLNIVELREMILIVGVEGGRTGLYRHSVGSVGSVRSVRSSSQSRTPGGPGGRGVGRGGSVISKSSDTIIRVNG